MPPTEKPKEKPSWGAHPVGIGPHLVKDIGLLGVVLVILWQTVGDVQKENEELDGRIQSIERIVTPQLASINAQLRDIARRLDRIETRQDQGRQE